MGFHLRGARPYGEAARTFTQRRRVGTSGEAGHAYSFTLRFLMGATCVGGPRDLRPKHK